MYGKSDHDRDDKDDKKDDDRDDKDDKKDHYVDRDGKDYGEREDHDSYADHNKKDYGQYIVGTKGDDKLVGGKGNDYIDGRRGDDDLFGKSGNDTIYGGRGDDTLVGGRGNDTLDGGRGEDDIVFSGVTNRSNGFDKILGFESGEDTLVFSLDDVNDAIKGTKNDLKKAASSMTTISPATSGAKPRTKTITSSITKKQACCRSTPTVAATIMRLRWRNWLARRS